MRKTLLCNLLVAGLFAGLPLMSMAIEDAPADKKPETHDTVSFKKLEQAMPDKMGGLDRTKIEGQSTKTNEIGVSTATATYAKDKDGNPPTIEVTAMDYNNPAMVLGMSAWTKIEMNTETDDEYTKTIKIDGTPCLEQFNTKNKEGSLTLVVADRFLLTVKVTGMEEADFKKLQTQLPLKEMAALAK